MNKEEILAMQAGEEMDTAIGKAFNLSYKNEFRCVLGDGMLTWHTELSEAKEWHEEFIKKNPNHPYSKNGGHIEAAMIYSPYSTDISAAMKVLEKLRETHCYRFHDMGRNMHKDEPHVVIFLPSDKGWEYGAEARASTLPLAICKAALLALIDS